ncbi:MAG TPA: DUF2993 domain-containing protein [Jatrophihabitantaceae bacterium]|jgi:hypothetical protein|nr:DUF2993 domain-containing protein [Jatrophihabitantaceae bacterium]
MLIALVVVAVLASIAVGIGLADRSIATLAERAASAYLAEPFGGPPTVRVHETPFLTQALRGRYRDVEVAGGGLQVGEISGATLNARLSNVLLPPRELLGRRTQEVACEHVAGRLLIPYGELARVSRVPGLTLSFERGRLYAGAALPVPGFSQLAGGTSRLRGTVRGRAGLLVDGNTVWLRVSELSVAGLSVTTLLLRQLMPRLNVAIGLPNLPWGLHIDHLEPSDAGLVVHVSASAVVFRAIDGDGRRPEYRDSDPAY